MPRRARAGKREISPDARYHNMTVARLANRIMTRGKKSTAERIVYGALDHVHEKTGTNPLEVLVKAVDNIKPRVEVKSRRVGGATYQVPVEINRHRQLALALRWLMQFSKAKKGLAMEKAMAGEILDAYRNQGNAMKKRDDTHKMAQANKAFAHYRW